MTELPTIHASTDKLNEVFELLGLFLKAGSQESVFRLYSINGEARIQALTSHMFDALIGETKCDIDVSLLYTPFNLPNKEDAVLLVVPGAVTIRAKTMELIMSQANTVLSGIEYSAGGLTPLGNQKQLVSAIGILDRLTELKNSFRTNATIEISGGTCRSRYPIAWVEVNTPGIEFEQTFDVSMARFLKLLFGQKGLQYCETQTAIYFERNGNLLMCARRYPSDVRLKAMTQNLQRVGSLNAGVMVESLKLFSKEAMISIAFNTDNTAKISSTMENLSVTKILPFSSSYSDVCFYSGPANFLLNIFYSLRGEVSIYTCHNKGTPLLQVESEDTKCLISSTS